MFGICCKKASDRLQIRLFKTDSLVAKSWVLAVSGWFDQLVAIEINARQPDEVAGEMEELNSLYSCSYRKDIQLCGQFKSFKGFFKTHWNSFTPPKFKKCLPRRAFLSKLLFDVFLKNQNKALMPATRLEKRQGRRRFHRRKKFLFDAFFLFLSWKEITLIIVSQVCRWKINNFSSFFSRATD